MTTAQQQLALPRLRAALHTRVEPPFALSLDDWLARAERAGAMAGQQVAAAVATQEQPPEASFVVSTLLDNSVTTNPQAMRRFTAAFEDTSGQRLHGLVNAYLCAGWGFVLRHAMRNTSLRRIALSVVDLDLHDMAWQLDHPVIGRAGFGLSALLFDLPAACAAPPQCGGPHANSAFTEFVLAMRAHRARHGLMPSFLPYTQPALHATAERVLGADTLAPNRYERWGHCFGSDPWMGLIEWLAARRVGGSAAGQGDTAVLAGAVGFNGYYTVAAMHVDAAMPIGFERVQGTPDAAWAAPSHPLIPPLQTNLQRGARTDRATQGGVPA